MRVKLEEDIKFRIDNLMTLLSKIAPFSKARIEKVKKDYTKISRDRF